MGRFGQKELDDLLKYVRKEQIMMIGGFDADIYELKTELPGYIMEKKNRKVLYCSLSKEKAVLASEDGLVESEKLIINDTPGLSIEDLRDVCLRQCAGWKLPEIIIIDDFALMTGFKNKTCTRIRELQSILNFLRWMAVELNIAIIIFVHFGRNHTKRMPELKDFNQYGAEIWKLAGSIVLAGRTPTWQNSEDEMMQCLVMYEVEVEATEKVRWASFYNLEEES